MTAIPWYALIVLALAAAGIIALAWGAQLREWATDKVLRRLRRGADAAEIDEDWAAKNVPDQDARDKGQL